MYEGVISCLKEDDILFVEMLEEGIAQDLVHTLPIARNQTLLVQVDKVALDLLIGLGLSVPVVDATHQIVPDLVPLDLLERIAEGLQLLYSALTEELLDNLREQIDVAVMVV